VSARGLHAEAGACCSGDSNHEAGIPPQSAHPKQEQAKGLAGAKRDISDFFFVFPSLSPGPAFPSSLAAALLPLHPHLPVSIHSPKTGFLHRNQDLLQPLLQARSKAEPAGTQAQEENRRDTTGADTETRTQSL